MTKPGLTFDRHVEIGRCLYRIREELVRVSVELEDAYPLSARFPQAVNRARVALDRARDAGDVQLREESPDETHVGVYYPAGG